MEDDSERACRPPRDERALRLVEHVSNGNGRIDSRARQRRRGRTRVVAAVEPAAVARPQAAAVEESSRRCSLLARRTRPTSSGSRRKTRANLP